MIENIKWAFILVLYAIGLGISAGILFIIAKTCFFFGARLTVKLFKRLSIFNFIEEVK